MEAEQALQEEVLIDFMDNKELRKVSLQMSKAIEAGLGSCLGPLIQKDTSFGKTLDRSFRACFLPQKSCGLAGNHIRNGTVFG